MVAWAIIAAVISVVASAGVYYQQKKMEAQAQKQANEAKAVQVSGHDSNRGLYTVYGQTLVGSTIVWKHVTDKEAKITQSGFTTISAATGSALTTNKNHKNNRWLYRAVTLCNGPVTDITNVTIDDEGYRSPRFTNKTNKHFATTYSVGPTAGQNFSALRSAYSSDFYGWASDAAGKGVAYAMERLYLHKDKPAYQGEPQTRYRIKGRALYDPRKDSTSSAYNSNLGTSTHRANTASTWAYSDNPVLALLDYMRSEEYGRGLDLSVIDIDSIATSADKCDVLVDIPHRLANDTGSVVTYYDPETGETYIVTADGDYPYYRADQQTTGTNANKQRRFRINMAVDPSKEILDNIQEILNVFRGNLSYANGTYFVHMADVASPVLTLNDDDIIGGLKIANGDRSQRMNRATVKFINQAKQYKTDQVSWPSLDSNEDGGLYATYLAQDEDEKLHRTFTIKGCTDFYQAQDTAEFLVRDSRSNLSVSGTFGSRCFGLVPGDVVALDYDSSGFSGKYFRVIQTQVDLVSMNVGLQLKEYDSSVYTWNTNRGNEPLGLSWQEEVVNADPTNLTLGTIATNTTTRSDGSASQTLTIPFSDVPEAAQYVEIGVATNNTTEYETHLVFDTENQTQAEIPIARDNQTYAVRARYFATNSYGTLMPSAYAETTHAVASLSGTKLDGIETGATSNTGDLADLDTVGTDEIDDDAVTIAKLDTSLESTNYATGVSGWKLTKAGVFEAGDGTFRGALTATSGSIADSVTVGGVAASTVRGNAAAGNQAASQISLLPRLDDSEWDLGTVTSAGVGVWSQNGNQGENVISLAQGPHGNTVKVWKATSTDESGADGGFFGEGAITPDTVYRFSVFIKQDNTNGSYYFGAYNLTQGGSNKALYKHDGTNGTTNKYWGNGDLPTQGDWYLLVGYINPKDSSVTSNQGGIYSVTTGKKVTSYEDWRFYGAGQTEDVTRLVMRTYQYYATPTPTAVIEWAHPRVDRMDRAAPSIPALLQGWTDLAQPLEAGVEITGGGITMSSGGAIKGGQTAYDTGIGFFLGYDTNYKFSIGNNIGDKLTFDGSDLSITGNITANSLTLDSSVAIDTGNLSSGVTGSLALADAAVQPGDSLTSGAVGPVTITSTKLYQGAGNHNQPNTGFYLDSDGDFSLQDKLSFDATTATLSVEGDIVADSIDITNATVTGTLSANNLLIDGVTLDTNSSGEIIIKDGGVSNDQLVSGSVALGNIIAGSVSKVNPVTQTRNIYRWAGYDDAGNVVNAVPSGITVSYDTTEKALELRNDGDVGMRSDTFVIDQNSIYKITFRVKKSITVGMYYVGAYQNTSAVTGSVQDGNNGQGSASFTIYHKDTRATSSGSNAYFADGGASTSYVEQTCYLMGANVNIDEVPSQNTTILQAQAGYNHVGLRILNWNNTSNITSLFVKDLSVVEMTATTIIAENISTTNLAAINSNLGAIDAGSINIGGGNFTVSTAGAMTATGATISGGITATSLSLNSSVNIGSANLDSTVVAGAAAGATANQDSTSTILGGNHTGTLNNVAASTVTSGAAAGATALQISDISEIISEGNIPTGKLTLNSSGNKTVTVSGNSFTSSGGTDNSWNTHVYSSEHYDSPLVLQFEIGTTGLRYMFGLNEDPTANASYSSIDYAFYQNVNTFTIYESGTQRVPDGGAFPYATGDKLSIVYDGTNVYYYHNETLKRTASNVGAKDFYFDSSLYDSNQMSINDIRFAPIANIDYGSVGGINIEPNRLYAGTGSWANSNTGFYLDNAGKFSLKDKLFFNPSNNTLTVDGNITADVITAKQNLIVLGDLQASSVATGSITRAMLSQDALDEIFGSLATSVGGSNGDFKDGSGTFTTSGGSVTLGTSSDKFDHGTSDVEVEFNINTFFYTTTNYSQAQAQATLLFEASANGTFNDLNSTEKAHTLQFFEYDLSSYYGYTYLVYYLNTAITKTFTSGSSGDIADNVQLQFRVSASSVGSAFTGQTIPFEVAANEGVTGVVSTGGNADTLDNLDSTAFLRSNTNDTFDGDLTITGQLILNGSIDQYNVTDLDVSDKTITVNSGNTQTLSNGAGLIVDRGTAADASILWNETADQFDVSHNIATPSIYLTKNVATTTGNGTFSVSKTRLGNIHITNGAGASGSPKEAAITFQGSNSSQSQAGIYVVNDDSSGTHMALATTNNYSTGPQIAINITNGGKVNFPRSRPTYAGYGLWASSDFTSGDISNWDTAYGWGDHSAAGYPTIQSSVYNGVYSIPIHSGGDLYTTPNAGAVTIKGSTGQISTPSHGNSSQWNTAYGWGNHASGGYSDEYKNLPTASGADYDTHHWNKTLAAYSKAASSPTYIVLTTNVPQDSYSMGSFTLILHNHYSALNEGDVVTIFGYFNPESNGGFTGFRYHTSNPDCAPTIQVGRNSSGKTVFLISGESGSYAQVVAKDLYLGFATGATSSYGDSWAFSEASSTTGISNLDTLNRVGITDAQRTNWNTAYTYSQVGHLPLAGGTLTGKLKINQAGTGTSHSNVSPVAVFSGQSQDGTINALSLVNSVSGANNNGVSIGFHNGNAWSPTGTITLRQEATGTVTNSRMVFQTYRGNLRDALVLDHDQNAIVFGHIYAEGGNITAGKANIDSAVKVFHSDGAYSVQKGWGMEFARNATYLRPNNDDARTMYFGASTLRWEQIQLHTSSLKMGAVEFLDASRNATLASLSATSITSTGKLSLDGAFVIDTDTGNQPLCINRLNSTSTTDNQSLRIHVNDSTAVFESEQDETGRYGGYLFKSKNGTNVQNRYEISHTTGDSIWYNDASAAKMLWDTSAERLGINTTTPATTLDVNGDITSSGNVSFGNGGNISMDGSANGQVEIKGSGYQGAIALDATAMRIYHNSSSRSLVLGTNETARLSIDGSGTFDFHARPLENIGAITTQGALVLKVSDQDSAHQRVDVRDETNGHSRAHWYSVSDNGTTSNFRHAWYDGSNYINVTAAGGKVTFGGNLAASSLEASSRIQVGAYTASDASIIAQTGDIQLRIGSISTIHNPYVRLQGANNSSGVYADIKLDATNQKLVFNDPGTSSGTIGQNPMALDSSGNLEVSGDINSSADIIADNSIQIGSGYNLTWGGTYITGNPTIAANSNTILFYPTGNVAGERLRLNATALVNQGTFQSDDITSNGYLLATSYLYTRTNLRVLNTAGDGWNTWATRVSGNYNLDVGSIASGAITSSGNISSSATLVGAHASAQGFYTYDSSAHLRVTHPGGAAYRTTTSTITGAIKIVLPQSWTSTMMRMTIKVYEYTMGESFTIDCGGYNYASSGSWINTFAYITGQNGTDRNFTVRFGHDGTKCCIYIGELNSGWSYPQVSVTDFQAGFNGTSNSNWRSGWDITFESSAFGTITKTHTETDNQRYHRDIVINGGNLSLRNNTAGDGAIIRDIEFLTTATSGGSDDRSVIIRASNQNGASTNRGGKLELLTRKTDGGYNYTTIDTTGGLTVQGLSTLENGLQTNNSQLRVKISPWTGTTYGIGMKSGMTFGGLNGYAMTFQMNSSTNRGWWWGKDSHSDAQGAMALTNAGKLSVASNTRIGMGYTDTVAPSGAMLEVGGGVIVHAGTVWDATTQGAGRGSIHLDPALNTTHAGGAITWGASDTSNGTTAQAGIYVRSDSSYGTRMYLSTTDSYASGAKTSLYINTNGDISVTRGSLVATGNVTAYSDIKLKREIKEIPDALAIVQKIRGVTYERIDKDDGLRHCGVIAQEVEAAGLPEVVRYDEENDVKTVDYGNMVALCIEAIKEQQDQINTLKNIIEEMKDGNNQH